jgi:cellulose synthase/poly-beta-1,6-N-acetylglucosamine synthase-like glycosyltransferase
MALAFWEIASILLYGIFMLYILAYSVSQFFFLLHFRRAKQQLKSIPAPPKEWPRVVVQLPVYNEKYVVERLLEAVALLDYPKEKLHIQVLDDSTDETCAIIDRTARLIQEKGIDITVLRRPNREGYKAGALAYGMQHCDADFVAIFDADFVPKPNFLKRTIPQFDAPEVGMVQGRWAHLNRSQSRLTRFQAFALDAHFSVEQGGRYHGGHFMNFNGTAGVWRKTCIVDAGGWQADTLTEDLDLSYRAQLRGWKFKFDIHTAVPAELPLTASAVRSQQYRWIKGAAECAVKLLPEMLRAKAAFSTKYHAFFHLLNSMVFVAVFFTSLLSIPILLILISHPELKVFFAWGAVFLLATVVLVGYYHESVKAIGEVKPLRFVPEFVMFLAIVMALSFHNTVAALQGYFGKKTAFVRTPKYNLNVHEALSDKLAYHRLQKNFFPFAEIMLGALFLMAAFLGIYFCELGLVFYHLLLSAGYFVWAGFSIIQEWKLKRNFAHAPQLSISIQET